eukprot:1478156-Pleurochrysis_carterae.AAC.1
MMTLYYSWNGCRQEAYVLTIPSADGPGQCADPHLANDDQEPEAKGTRGPRPLLPRSPMVPPTQTA